MSHKTVSEWLGMDVPLHKDRKSSLDALSYLWKVDDPEWVEQRELDWKALRELLKKDGCKKDELALLEGYFKSGEAKDYIPTITLFFYAPYKTKDDLKLLLGSALFPASERKKILRDYLFALYQYRNLSWYDSHKECFAKTFYAGKYEKIIDYNGKFEVEISPEPSYWTNFYVNQSVKALNENTIYAPCFDCVIYFKSILPYAKKQKFRKTTKINELLSLIDEGKAGSLSGLNDNASEFLERLIASEDEIVSAWQAGEE